MNGASGGLRTGRETLGRDHIDNLEGGIASDTVNTEVNTNSYRCLRLRIAG
jgi:hypothetical protein